MQTGKMVPLLLIRLNSAIAMLSSVMVCLYFFYLFFKKKFLCYTILCCITYYSRLTFVTQFNLHLCLSNLHIIIAIAHNSFNHSIIPLTPKTHRSNKTWAFKLLQFHLYIFSGANGSGLLSSDANYTLLPMDSVYRSYISSLYWAVATVTSTG